MEDLKTNLLRLKIRPVGLKIRQGLKIPQSTKTRQSTKMSRIAVGSADIAKEFLPGTQRICRGSCILFPISQESSMGKPYRR